MADRVVDRDASLCRVWAHHGTAPVSIGSVRLPTSVGRDFSPASTLAEATAEHASIGRDFSPAASDGGQPDGDVSSAIDRRESMNLLERYRGAMLGLAAGDALGTTVEFKEPGSFAPLTDIVGGGPFGLEAGQWTDDTSMALCLAESLIECRGFDALDRCAATRAGTTTDTTAARASASTSDRSSQPHSSASNGQATRGAAAATRVLPGTAP